MGEEWVGTISDALQSLLADTVSPAWIVAGAGIVIGLLAFHGALGSPPHRWWSDAPFAVGGFAAGNLVGYLVNWPLPVIGDVHPVEAIVGTWVVLGAVASLKALAPAMPERLFRRGRWT